MVDAHLHTDQNRAGKLLLNNLTVVDTRSGQLLPERSVLCTAGRIIEIAPANSTEPDDDTQIVDATGKYAVPGYLDMHMHVIGERDTRAYLALLLANGVTGFRQMTGSSELLKNRQAGSFSGSADEPELLSMPGELLLPFNTTKAADAVELVRKQKLEGADFIKIGLVSPKILLAVLDEAKRQDIPVCGHVPADMDIAEASRAGFHSVEHLGPAEGDLIACSSDEDALRATSHHIPRILSNPLMKKLGALGPGASKKIVLNPNAATVTNDTERMRRIVNTYSEEKAKRLAAVFNAHDTWQAPTLIRQRTSLLAFLPEHRDNPDLQYVAPDIVKDWTEFTDSWERGLSAEGKEAALHLYEQELTLVRLFDHEGVKMLVGTDAAEGGGWLVAGSSLHQELDELDKAGLPPLHVLQMTTLNGAAYLDRTEDLGTIEPGKAADLVLLDANPIESVQNLHRIDAVIRAGTYHSKEDLAALKEKARISVQDKR